MNEWLSHIIMSVQLFRGDRKKLPSNRTISMGEKIM